MKKILHRTTELPHDLLRMVQTLSGVNLLSVELPFCELSQSILNIYRGAREPDLMLNMQYVKYSVSSPVCFAVCVQASPGGCEGGGRVEEVLRAEEAPCGVGLHTQEPVQETGGVSTFSPCTSLWYDNGRLWCAVQFVQPILARSPCVSSLTRRLSSSKTERFRDDQAPVLFWRFRLGVSLWTGTDTGVWRCRHGHPLLLIVPQSCDYFTEEIKPVCIMDVSICEPWLPGVISTREMNCRCCWLCCAVCSAFYHATTAYLRRRTDYSEMINYSTRYDSSRVQRCYQPYTDWDNYINRVGSRGMARKLSHVSPDRPWLTSAKTCVCMWRERQQRERSWMFSQRWPTFCINVT